MFFVGAQGLQAVDENRHHAFLQFGAGQVVQCLAGDGENLLLCPAADFLVEILHVLLQVFLTFGGQLVGILARRFKQALAFAIGSSHGLGQHVCFLFVESGILLLEIGAILGGFRLFRIGVGEFVGDALLPRVDGIED